MGAVDSSGSFGARQTYHAIVMTASVQPPFLSSHQLCAELDNDHGPQPDGAQPPHVPGYPHVSLKDRFGLLKFLENEYCSVDLDQIADRLWWMSKQDSANISPLHRQFVKRRNIVATEDPKLHLVWIYDRIFVKPLPRYITSYAFWRDFLGADADPVIGARTWRVRRAALGYLRTYLHLIRSEYDFHIAQSPELRLVPVGITWEQFCGFTTHLARISDWDVSGRYAYGEIRLTRLNFYAPLVLGKSHFQRVEYQYGEYFSRFYGPILFLIGIISITMNGLQIAVTVQQAKPMWNGGLLLDVALWFSIMMILCFCGILFLLFVILVYKIAMEWKFAIRDRRRLVKAGHPACAGG